MGRPTAPARPGTRGASCSRDRGLGRHVLAGPDETGFVGEHHRLDAITQVELFEDACDVRLRGVLADDELGGDLGIGETAGDEPQDLAFPWCEVGQFSTGTRPPGKCCDEASGHGRCEERTAVRDDADGRDELLLLGVLEQKRARAGVQRLLDVFVKVECGQHQNAGGPFAPGDLACGLDAVDAWHPDVHKDDVGRELGGTSDCFSTVLGFADDVDVGLGLKDHPKAGSNQALVVGE